MKYSIIIPTLNEEKLLPNLLNQLDDDKLKSNFDFEIIITDGGSTDQTLNIAKQFDRVKIFSEEKKQNIGEGRNKGVNISEGEILIFINADVTIENPFKLFTFIKDEFIKPDYLALACSVKVSLQEETLVDKLFHSFYNNYFLVINFLGMGMGRGECQIVKRNIFEKVGGYNPTLAAGEDFDLFRRIRKLGKILYSKDLIVYESPRRYRKLGYFNVTLSWFQNSFTVVLKNRSLHKNWEQIR